MTQPQDRQVRVVIDNSVLVAILRHRNPGNNWLIGLWTSGRIVPLVSQETAIRNLMKSDTPASPEYSGGH